MTLASIVALGERLRSKEKALAVLNQQVVDLNKEITKISLTDLPEAMREEGLKAFKLKDGTEIELKDDFLANISADRAAPAFKWLREHGFGGLIKNSIAVTLARGEDEAAQVAADELREQFGADAVALKSEVHRQTLLAFVREQATKGKLPPTELFGIHPYTKAIAKGARE